MVAAVAVEEAVVVEVVAAEAEAGLRQPLQCSTMFIVGYLVFKFY